MRKIFLILALAWLPLAAQAQVAQGAERLAQRYPYGAIQSVEMADQALAEVEDARRAVEAAHAAEERLCAPKFFTTACIDEAKERRRDALARLRSIEVEANTFKRRARAAERDTQLSELRLQDELELRRREEAAAKRRADEALAARQVKEEDTLAEQKRRADNVAAYEKKQKEAAERLRQRDEKRKSAEAAKLAKPADPAKSTGN